MITFSKILLYCLLLYPLVSAGQSYSWPSMEGKRTSYKEPSPSKGKRPARYRQTKYYTKKPLPRKYKAVDRVYVETASSNLTHIDYYYDKRDATPYAQKQSGMIYNRSRDPEKTYKRKPR